MATRSPSVAREPQARYCHAAVGVGQTHYVWGGLSSGTLVQASTVGLFGRAFCDMAGATAATRTLSP